MANSLMNFPSPISATALNMWIPSLVSGIVRDSSTTPYPFHNDILKVFVEVGFPGFLLGPASRYVLTPLFWHGAMQTKRPTLLYLVMSWAI